MRQLYKNWRNERLNADVKTVFLMVCQLTLTIYLVKEVFNDPKFRNDFYAPPSDRIISFTRFLCAILLHVSLQDEITQGGKLMKFAANHPWKFRKWYIAWLCGFFQMILVVFVEIVNIVVLNTNDTVMDILMNFLALVILADFDDYFFSTV